MTYQIRDRLLHNNDEWFIEERSGNDLFNPADFGLHVSGASSTACWDGYSCTFIIEGTALLLAQLEINLYEKNVPSLNGIEPVKANPSSFTSGGLVYSSLQLPVLYTGGLIIGQNGFQKLPSSIGPELI